jgi:hypothetical protein
MKPVRLVLLTFLLLFTKPVWAQTDTIPWQDGIKLTWADFKGTPDNSARFLAYTDYMMTINYSYNGSSINIRLGCYFDRNKSWVKAGKEKDSLLMHEKAHFAIAEIYARKARKAITDTTLLQSNINDVIQAIYNRASKECNLYQVQYDNETQHSKIYKKQVEWLNKIYAQLDALKAYSSTVVQKNIQ